MRELHTKRDGSQMTEQDIEYVMARIATMDDTKKNLDRAIREDKKYLREVMGEREELVTRSFTATTKSFKRQSVMKLDEIKKILGDEAADKVTRSSEVTYLNINQTKGPDWEPFIIDDLEMLPGWARDAYYMLHGELHA